MYEKLVNNVRVFYADEGKKIFYKGFLLSRVIPAKELELSDFTEVDDADYTPIENVNEEPLDPLQVLKDNQIKLSKKNLAKYLEEHPLFSTVKYEEGRYYNVTSEKQQQLTSKLIKGYISITEGKDYQLTWNDTGNVCEPYSYEELKSLFKQIDNYVAPLVSLQQTIEVRIRDCVSQDEVLKVSIEFEDEIVEDWVQSYK